MDLLRAVQLIDSDKLTKQFSKHYTNFPAHPKLFITSVNKTDPPPRCELNTGIIEQALEKGEMKKLETYVLWSWLRSDNVHETKYEEYFNGDYNIRQVRHN